MIKTTVGNIANLAGVSRATVSAIISGGGSNVRVSESTRRKVFEIAERLKYKPPTTNNIGIIHSVGNKDPEAIDWVGWISPMLASIHSEAAASNKLVSVFGYSSQGLQEDLSAELPQIFKRKKIDGMIVSGLFNEPLLGCLQRYRVPFVLMNVSDSHIHAEDSICFDESFTGSQATRHLIELGHKRILYADVKWSGDHYSVSLRREGYEKAMREARLASRVVYHEKEDEDLIGQIVEVLKGPDRPTAIFAYNEIVALCCYRAICRLGMSFEDVNLIGVVWNYDRAMEALGITCLHLPARQMGKLAFRALVQKMAAKEPAAALLLRGVIKPGQSTFVRKGE
jgi:DNA-binding LacI/PurR family transcriptional regulator